MSQGLLVVGAVAGLLAAPLVVLQRTLRDRRAFVSTAERAAHDALHEASLAAPPLREGLTAAAAGRSARHLRRLLGSAAVALTDTRDLLTWEGEGAKHASSARELAASALATGRTSLARDLTCDDLSCRIRTAVVAPIVLDDRVVGTLTAYDDTASPGRVRTVEEVARWVSGQLELAELDDSRSRLAEAQVRALRAQISPHFVYNALTTIASFVRTDPERARELLLEFADFTRYSFRRHGDFTTLAEELRSIDRYLLLERARFGDDLHVTLRIAPEVLPVAVPFLCVQPLVENAVRHGLENKPGPGRITILAEDGGAECVISVEDDGVGMDPDQMRRVLAGEARSGAGIGLANVDERQRQVYGDAYGLVVETAEGAGMKVSLRVPKYRPGVSAT